MPNPEQIGSSNPLVSTERTNTRDTGNLRADIDGYELILQLPTLQESNNLVENTTKNILPEVIFFDSSESDDTLNASYPQDVQRFGENTPQYLKQVENPPNITAEYREDGTIMHSHEQLPDGSTRFTRYYQPSTSESDFPLIAIGTPEEETLVNPDGSSRYTRFDTDGRREFVQQTDSSGTVTTESDFGPDGRARRIETTNTNGDTATYTRRADGTLEGTVQFADGSTATGTFFDDLSPRDANYTFADGRSRSVRYDERTGISTSATSYPDGREVTVRTEFGKARDIVLDTSTRYPDGRVFTEAGNTGTTIYPDGSRTVTTDNADGSSRTVRYGADGRAIGSIDLPPNSYVQHLPNGGLSVDRYGDSRSPHPTRSFTIDANGNYVSEVSYHAGTDNVRERINYGIGTRSVTTFSPGGALVGTNANQPVTVPNIRD